MATKTIRQVVNGYLEIFYRDDEFIVIRDMESDCKIEMHETVIKIISKTIRNNNKNKRGKK